MENTNASRLDAIRERFKNASPGPWSLDGCLIVAETGDIINDGEWYDTDLENGDFSNNEDFVAHSWEDIKFLLSEVDRLNEIIRSRETPGTSL